jgi:hypothetical protein
MPFGSLKSIAVEAGRFDSVVGPTCSLRPAEITLIVVEPYRCGRVGRTNRRTKPERDSPRRPSAGLGETLESRSLETTTGRNEKPVIDEGCPETDGFQEWNGRRVVRARVASRSAFKARRLLL